MAYSPGFWAELVLSTSDLSLVEDATGGTVWLRTSDGLPLEQEFQVSSGGAWIAISGDTDEPDRIGTVSGFSRLTHFHWRARKTGEAWIPSDDGLDLRNIPWTGSTYRFFEVPATPTTAAPSWNDDTGDAVSGTVGTAVADTVVPAVDAGNPAPVYTASGLPAGASFTAATRTIAWGTPGAAASGTVTITATNSQGSDTWTVAYNFEAAPTTTETLVHTFSVVGQYRLGTGLAAGSSASYDTPGGKSVTIQHCRPVGGTELNFAISPAAVDAADFPSRIVATKQTGGVVERSFGPQAGSLRDISGGGNPAGTVRQDYDPASGSVGDVFVSGQTIVVQLYYQAAAAPSEHEIAPNFAGTAVGALTVPPLVRGRPEVHEIAPSFAGTAVGALTVPALVHTEAPESIPLSPEFSGAMSGALTAVPERVSERPPSFAVDTGSPAYWRQGVAIDAIVVPEAAGKPAPTYAVVGNLPAGITFNANTRTIAGTPTAAGTGTVTIRATNSEGSDDWTVDFTTLAPTTAATTSSTADAAARLAVTLDSLGNQLETQGSVVLTANLTGALAASATLDWTLVAGNGRLVPFGSNQAIYAIPGVDEDEATTIRVTATATDSGTTRTATATVTFTIIPVFEPPRPVINTPAQTVRRGAVVALAATDSDRGGVVVSRRWSATGGTFQGAVNARRASWVAPAPDLDTDYVATYTVVDDDGQFASATVVITVLGAVDHQVAPNFAGTAAGTLTVPPLVHTEAPESIPLPFSFEGTAAGTLTVPPLVHTEAPETIILPFSFAGAMAGTLTAPLFKRQPIHYVLAAPTFVGSMAGALTVPPLVHTEAPETILLPFSFDGTAVGAFDVLPIAHAEVAETILLPFSFAGAMAGDFPVALVHSEVPENIFLRPFAFFGSMSGDLTVVLEHLAGPALDPVRRDSPGVFDAPIQWDSGFRETFAFRTGIVTHRRGNEQRIAHRTKPRIAYEFTTWLDHPGFRRAMQNAAFRPGHLIYFPHARDAARVASAIAPGVAAFDVEAVPGWLTPGSVVFFGGRNPEAASIMGVEGNRITAFFPVRTPRAAGSRLYRGVPARLSDSLEIRTLTSRAGTMPLRLDGDPVRNWHAGFPEAAPEALDGREYFELPPDWSSVPTRQLRPTWEDVDFQRGAVSRIFPVPYPSFTGRYRFLMHTPERIERILGLFHRARGRQKSWYMPTHFHDLEPVSAIPSGAMTFDVRGTDAVRTFAESPVFRRLRFADDRGSFVRTVAGVAASGPNSRFTLDAGVPRRLSPETLKMVSWVNRVRFETDSLVVDWRTDGVGETVLNVRTLEDVA